MKKTILFILLIINQFILAQHKMDTVREAQNDTLVYSITGLEIQPEYDGGKEKFYEFFNSNFNKQKVGIKGKIVVIFTIEKDGTLSNIKVLRPIGVETRKEIIKVLKLAPKWIPGAQNGKIVRTLYSFEFPMDYNTQKELINDRQK